MPHEHEFHNFGSSENLLAYIKEKSDDIDRAVILPPGTRFTDRGRAAGATQEFTMMLHMADGEREQIGQVDTLVVLNDGILNRMKIKIEFL